MNNALESIPTIIETAAKNPFGIMALTILGIFGIAYLFFRRSSDNIKIWVFGSLFLLFIGSFLIVLQKIATPKNNTDSHSESIIQEIKPANPEWQILGRFQVKEGIAKDNHGLMWMRCIVGSEWNSERNICLGKGNSYEWLQANQAIKSFEYAGYKDWRLPTITELKTLIEKNIRETDNNTLFINRVVFPMENCKTISGRWDWSNNACWIWSSTASVQNTQKIYFIYFGGIKVDMGSPYLNNGIRLVRP
ncbi:MAG: hypothetical protein RL637_927 [Pseudomonadota bacterium]|jgi:hypothetical protein